MHIFYSGILLVKIDLELLHVVIIEVHKELLLFMILLIENHLKMLKHGWLKLISNIFI